MSPTQPNWSERTPHLLKQAGTHHRFSRFTPEAPAQGLPLRGRLETASGAPFHFQAEICGERSVRVRISLSPDGPRPTPILLQNEWPSPAGARLETTPDQSALRSPEGWELRVSHAPFALSLHSAEGRVLWRTEHRDRRAFNGGWASPPSGFTEDEYTGRVVLNAALAADEALYGFGERFGPLNQRGQNVPCWHAGSGTWTRGTHKNIPLLLSSRGYGLFVNTLRPVLFDLGYSSNAATTLAVADNAIDLFLHIGDFKSILREHTGFTGRPGPVPGWAFGIWMGKHTYASQAEVLAVAERLRAENCPASVLKIDTGWFHREGRGSLIDYDMEWSPSFPDPKAMADRLHALGFKLCVFVQAWFLADSAKAVEARERGFLVRRADGEEHRWDMGKDCPVVAVDLTLEPARLWYKEQLKTLLDQGVDTFFCDWGVNAPTDVVYANADPLDYNHLHALLYLQTAREAIVEHSGDPAAVTWSLCGCAGAQRFPVTYSGDSRTCFRDMASVLRGGLSCALSGFGLWGGEIGGFGHLDLGPPDPELYIRYVQHGFLCPLAEFHGIGDREPWHYGETALTVYREFAALREGLLPYLQACARETTDTGLPVLRPMVLEFPDDPNCRTLDLQYLLGPDLLVAPVFERGQKSVNVYLPAGEWRDLWSDETHHGPGWRIFDAPLDRIPVLRRVSPESEANLASLARTE